MGQFIFIVCFAHSGTFSTCNTPVTIWSQRRNQTRSCKSGGFYKCGGFTGLPLCGSGLPLCAVKYFANEEFEKQRYALSIEKYQKFSVAMMASLSVLNMSQQLIVNLCLCLGLMEAGYAVLHGVCSSLQDTCTHVLSTIEINEYLIGFFLNLMDWFFCFRQKACFFFTSCACRAQNNNLSFLKKCCNLHLFWIFDEFSGTSLWRDSPFLCRNFSNSELFPFRQNLEKSNCFL